MMIQLIVAGVIAAVAAGGGFWAGLKMGTAEVQGWIEVAAECNAQQLQIKEDGDARAKRAEEQASKATAELARVRKQAEADRANWIREASDGWTAYLDSERVRNTPKVGSDGEIALAACRSDASSTRSALRAVLEAAFAVHSVATINTEQLKQLQDWIREVTK